MKYYIKATNTETNESMIMTVPVFTNKAKANDFITKMEKCLTPVGKLEIIKEKSK